MLFYTILEENNIKNIFNSCTERLEKFLQDPELFYVLNLSEDPSQLVVKAKIVPHSSDDSIHHIYTEFFIYQPIMEYYAFNLFMTKDERKITQPNIESKKILYKFEDRKTDTMYFIVETKTKSFLFFKGKIFLDIYCLRKLKNGKYVEVRKSVDIPGYDFDENYQKIVNLEYVQEFTPIYDLDGEYLGATVQNFSISIPKINTSFAMIKPFLIKAVKTDYFMTKKLLDERIEKNDRSFLKMINNKET